MRLFNSRLSKKDKTIIFGLLFIMLIFGLLTYRHFNQRVERISASKALGIVRYKYNSVKRKYADRFIWEDIKSYNSVYLKDSILAGEDSEALIRLNSGVEIEIDANSLIEIDIIGDSVGLSLKKGIIRAKGTQNDSTLIKTSSGLIADIKGSDVIINQGKGEKTGVYVKSGNIEIKDNKGSYDVIGPDRMLELTSDGKWQLEEVHINTLTPEEGAIVVTKARSKQILFAWRSQLDLRAYRLYLSQDPSFENKKVIRTRNNKYSINLNKGAWYWQVFSEHNGKKASSAISSFGIQEYKTVKIVAPKNKSIVVSKPSESIVFRWKLPEGKSTVKFYLATDKRFNNIVRSDVVASSFYAVKGLRRGKYYWKVEPEFSNRIYKDKKIDKDEKTDEDKIGEDKVKKETAEIQTKENIFVVNDIPPVLKRPVNLKPSLSLTLNAGLDKNIRFSWGRVAKASSYRIKLFLDNDDTPLLNRQVDQNYFVHQIPWETKVISWEVISLLYDQRLKLIQKSKPAKARANVTYRLPEPPKILSATAKILY